MGLNQQLDLFKVELRASLPFSLAAMAAANAIPTVGVALPVPSVGAPTDGGLFEGILMIRFYFHPTPNPAKVALFLEEAGPPTRSSRSTRARVSSTPSFRAINPNGKVPAIVDTEGPGGKETRVFDSTAILLYLAEKTGKFLGKAEDRPELLSWLLFIGSGLGPFSGQSVHFQFAAPEGPRLRQESVPA